jgi:hypothetical protein
MYLQGRTRRMAAVVTVMMVLTALCGCYDYGLLGSLLGGDLLGGNVFGTSPLDGWVGGGAPVGVPVSGTTYPPSTLYDPTDTIQSVIDYRQDVYDRVNDAWDEYIRQ